jgi:hypothetical protein
MIAAKHIQEALVRKGLIPASAVDGVIGQKTRDAMDTALAGANLPAGWDIWAPKRREIAFQQLIAREAGFDPGPVDGFVGPLTQYAFDCFQQKAEHGTAPENFRDRDPAEAEPKQPKPVWCRQSECERFYGAIGAHQTRLQLPYPMVLAWDTDTPIKTFMIHEKVHDSAKRVLERVANAYSESQRKDLGLHLFGGCLNPRPMRGGTRPSMHSWGIAIDFDPERNQLKWGRDRARLGKPDAEKFWQLWEEEGWVPLGRVRNFDWMHVQAARL